MKLSIYFYDVILNIADLISLCGTLMIYGSAHVLIDDHISRIMDMRYQINNVDIC